MSNKINFGTISNQTLETASSFLKNMILLHQEQEDMKAEWESAVALRDEVLRKREEYKKEHDGVSVDVLDSIFPELPELNRQIGGMKKGDRGTIRESHGKKIKEYKAAMKGAAESIVPEKAYIAYLGARSGDSSALAGVLEKFLLEIGCHTDNKKGMEKFQSQILARIGGDRAVSLKSCAEKGWTKLAEAQKEGEFAQKFLKVFLTMLVVDYGVLTIDEKNIAYKMRDFSLSPEQIKALEESRIAELEAFKIKKGKKMTSRAEEIQAKLTKIQVELDKQKAAAKKLKEEKEKKAV